MNLSRGLKLASLSQNYHAENLHYFLIDFCYIGNFLLLFYLHFYPNSVVLFEVV